MQPQEAHGHIRFWNVSAGDVRGSSRPAEAKSNPADNGPGQVLPASALSFDC